MVCMEGRQGKRVREEECRVAEWDGKGRGKRSGKERDEGRENGMQFIRKSGGGVK